MAAPAVPPGIPAGSPVPPAQPRPSAKKSSCLLRGCLALVVLGILAACIFGGTSIYLDRANYQKAHAFYQQANCAEAVPIYTQIIAGLGLTGEADLARAERSECNLFDAAGAAAAAGQFDNALNGYLKFVQTYPSSPLTQPARAQMAEILAAAPESLATDWVCTNFDELAATAGLAAEDPARPHLLLGCGQGYALAGDFLRAALFYERFLKTYPDHPSTAEVEKAYADALINDARSRGAGEITAPQKREGTSGVSTTVIIQNDSPNRLRIVFRGADTRIEEIEPCADCEKFTGSGPEFCPEKGPIGRFELVSGTYDVMVESSDGANVSPFTGVWPLEGGEYYTCFFIVTE